MRTSAYQQSVAPQRRSGTGSDQFSKPTAAASDPRRRKLDGPAPPFPGRIRRFLTGTARAAHSRPFPLPCNASDGASGNYPQKQNSAVLLIFALLTDLVMGAPD
ncbi:hypothetical protein AB0P07_24890 [Streptomyces sp. NPDC085944]|uniref:hypothetical protein n=1 Tax=Streptomyces sp. NPDC085944 TaxID=3154962 RepID=UPI00342B85C0